MEYTKLIQLIKRDYFCHLTTHRSEHSLRTAHYAHFMAGLFHSDQGKAFFAGYTHDIAKERSSQEILHLAHLYKPHEIIEEERQFPLLLHGRAGAGLLLRDFHLDDEDILDSITWHVTGVWPMSVLSKIIYCADYLEPGRTFLTQKFRERALSQDLDFAVKNVVSSLLDHRVAKGHKPSKREQQLLDHFGIKGRLL